VTEVISRKQRRLRQRSDEPWSRLQTECFDRCFWRVSLYVSRHVNDRESIERIVTEVLAGNLDLFIAQCSELEELKRLKASADRLLALGASTSLDAETPSSAGEHDVCAAQPDNQG
jgi:hypothetical protein